MAEHRAQVDTIGMGFEAVVRPDFHYSRHACSGLVNHLPRILHLQDSAIVAASLVPTQSDLSAAVTVPKSGQPASSPDQKRCCFLVVVHTALNPFVLEAGPEVQAQPGFDFIGATSSAAEAEEVGYQPCCHQALLLLLMGLQLNTSGFLQIPLDHIVIKHLKKAQNIRKTIHQF